ncbi:MAG: hypothetical protein R6V40_01815 [Candidatus Moraniibacteriota bacterium]
MFNFLLNYYSKALPRYFKREKTAKFFTLAGFFVLGGALIWGLYLFFMEGFGYISGSVYFGDALFLYVYEMFFPILVFLLVFSGVIFGIFSLFKGGDNYWIIASPRYETLFIHKILTVLASSLWPVIIIALPFALAVAVFFNLNILSFWLLLAGIFFFCLSAVLASVIIVFLSAGLLFLLSVFLKRNLLKSGKLTVIALLFFIVLGMFFWLPMAENRPGNIFNPEDLNASFAGTEKIEDQFGILPTHLIAKAVFQTQNKNFPLLEWSLIVIILVGSIVVVTLLKKRFLFLWQRLQEGEFKAETKVKKHSKRNAFKKTKSLGSTFFMKEILKLVRNKRNFLWLIFSLSLWLLYSGVNYFFIKHSDFEDTQKELIPFAIAALQFLVAVYFTTALVLRFSFPSFSEERKSIWVIAGAPIDLGRVFIYRAIFYSLIFVVVGFVFGFFNFIQFEAGWLKILLSLDMFALSIVFVSVLGLSLGAIFPNFETDDPQQLSTSLPGLGFIFSSLIYGVLASYAFYRFYFLGDFWVYWIFGLFSVVIILILTFLSVKSLRNREFVKIF